MSAGEQSGGTTLEGYRAVETIYHAYLTGLILTLVTRRGRADAAELVFRLFRRQHLEKFLPGLEKLGLTGLPDPVAAAQYHYLSNHLGGVNVQYIYESDRKAWIRYLPPRWIFDGTAICGVTTEVSRAMMRGWHAHNGVSMGNPRMGFVCTGQTTDGQPGLEGYYLEYDRDLAPEERLRFEPGEEGPDFDPASAPKLDSDSWPPERLAKAERNYCMEYIRNILPEIVRFLGPEEGGSLAAGAATLIGMQYYGATAKLLRIEGDSPEAFAKYLKAMGEAQGDEIDYEVRSDEVSIQQRGWRLMRGLDHLPMAVFDAWNGLWRGALSVHNRHLMLEITRRTDPDDESFQWRIRSKKS